MAHMWSADECICADSWRVMLCPVHGEPEHTHADDDECECAYNLEGERIPYEYCPVHGRDPDEAGETKAENQRWHAEREE